MGDVPARIIKRRVGYEVAEVADAMKKMRIAKDSEVAAKDDERMETTDTGMKGMVIQ